MSNQYIVNDFTQKKITTSTTAITYYCLAFLYSINRSQVKYKIQIFKGTIEDYR